ncbi:major facilitator superfamily domain-containing protein 12-like isoform X3 [Actinia tenebrosa]|uniref:Major facilitator superfamily domain-containing protein 12-like isoform X3 n=1 Tax=Actinia tenebrosa TaxID=6105 RepID=A0A6P8IKU7_ACTTE|nr:major facilitator superfamily domain-containing protein 12-like isoform X3 [Actinia tenebrosa]
MESSCKKMMFNCQPFRRGGPKSTTLLKDERLIWSQKLSFACGHVLNDLVGSAWFSYLLVFLTKVSELSNAHAGYVILSSQILEALWNPVVGRLCDRTISRYGRRKLWHLVGTFCVTITVPMMFMRCISCEDEPSGTKMWYYIGLGTFCCFGWGATQIGHLALIPEICRSKTDAIELSALRSAVTFMCGIFIYVVTWILLGQSKEESLSPNVWKQFMYLGFIIVGTGTFFNFLYHIWTDEPPNEGYESKDISNNLSKNKSRKLKKAKVPMKASCFSSKSMNSKTTTSACTKNKRHTEEAVSLTKNENTEPEGLRLEVIERNIVVGKADRKLSEWLKEPSFYKTNILYMCSRWVVIISQAYLPLYLIETLQFEKESIAYFPLVVLISGVAASPSVGPLNKRFGSKMAFIVGCLLSLAASIWFFLQSIEGKNAVYMAAILIGCGGSIMLATSLSFIAEVIGQNKSSGAFVYGTIGFTDKLSSGIVIAIIQVLNPRPNGDSFDFRYSDSDRKDNYRKRARTWSWSHPTRGNKPRE